MSHIDQMLSSPRSVIIVGDNDRFLDWLHRWRQVQSPTTTIQWLTAVHNESDQTITIAEVREIQESLSYSFGAKEGRDIVLLSAESCSLPAQHALLKMVEEPPNWIKFWLVTTSPTVLLETIQSRCHLITYKELQTVLSTTDQLSDQFDANSSETMAKQDCKEQPNLHPKITPNDLLAALKQDNPGRMLTVLQQVGNDRTTAIEFVRALLMFFRTSGSHLNPVLQTCSLDALEWLQANANVSLTMDNLAISLWQHRG